jgi:hypothetical protein
MVARAIEGMAGKAGNGQPLQAYALLAQRPKIFGLNFQPMLSSARTGRPAGRPAIFY